MGEIAKLPITILIAAFNEEKNIQRCLAALSPAGRVVILDSNSQDRTCEIARTWGADIVQFKYQGGYPKKRQWALDQLAIKTPWILLIDADEVIPASLWEEIAAAIHAPRCPDAFLITKGFHFLGQRFRFGGFSHSAVLLFKAGKARFEQLQDDASDGFDMEVHERMIVPGAIGRLNTPLIHEDFKGLEAYLHRHNKYSTWEAKVRFNYMQTGRYGRDTIQPNLFGNAQERRRALKAWVIRLPGEPCFWFAYHYFFRLGFLEGKAGLIASQIRTQYISQVRAKMHELRIGRYHEAQITSR